MRVKRARRKEPAQRWDECLLHVHDGSLSHRRLIKASATAFGPGRKHGLLPALAKNMPPAYFLNASRPPGGSLTDRPFSAPPLRLLLAVVTGDHRSPLQVGAWRVFFRRGDKRFPMECVRICPENETNGAKKPHHIIYNKKNHPAGWFFAVKIIKP